MKQTRYVLQMIKLIYADNTGSNSDVLHPVILGNKLIDVNGCLTQQLCYTAIPVDEFNMECACLVDVGVYL